MTIGAPVAGAVANRLLNTDGSGNLADPTSIGGQGTMPVVGLSGMRFVLREVNALDYGALGDGSGAALSTVYATLAAAQAVYPFATALTQTLDFCGIQAALNHAGPLNGVVTLSSGNYVMNSLSDTTSYLSFPASTSLTLAGPATFVYAPAYQNTGATLTWNGDTTLAPDAQWMIDTTPCGVATIANLSIQGPSTYSYQLGGLRCRLGGIHGAGRTYIKDVAVSNASSGIAYGGTSGQRTISNVVISGSTVTITTSSPIPNLANGQKVYVTGVTGVGTGPYSASSVSGSSFAITQAGASWTSGGTASLGISADHIYIDGLYASNVGYGWHILPQSTTQGDVHFCRMNIQATLAAGAVASSCGGVNGATITTSGMLAPFGIYRYDDSTATGSAFLINNKAISLSSEFAGHSVIYDELWNSSSRGGKINYNPFQGNTIYKSPTTSEDLWTKTFNVTSASGTTLTIADTSGFVFRPGMVVTVASGGGSYPANTTISTVNTTFGNTAPSFTLTGSPTGTVTTVTIAQPMLGSIVAATIVSNTFQGQMLQANTGYPVLYGTNVQHNAFDDGVTAWTNAATAHLTGPNAGNTYGNRWGNEIDVMLGSASMAFNATCLQGDLVMQAVGISGNPIGCVAVCDGTRRPLGVAVLASGVTNGYAPCDYVVRAQGNTAKTATSGVLVRNKTAATIAAGSLVYADQTNPGGVTATAPTTGWITPVGVVGGTAIAGGSTGYLDQIWL